MTAQTIAQVGAPPVIAFDQVSKRYRGARLALDDITLALPAGGSLGLVGESGSGKTTCVRLALGLERPTAGRLTFNGAAYPAGRSGLRPLRRQIGFVLQDPYDSLDARMTVRDIVAEPLRIHRLPGGRGRRGDELVAELLAAVGLPGADLRSYPSRYSGGGRQRIAIARALIAAPTVLICDEPTSSLDVSVQSQIINLLLDARRERDLSMLFVSHDLDLIGRVADTVAVMYGGRVLEIGPADLIRRSPRHPYTRALHEAVPADHPRHRRLADRHAVAPDTGAPDTVAPHTGAPDSGAPDTGAPDTGAPDTGAPDTGAPDTDARDSCVFADRCPRAQDRCRLERPPVIAEDSVRSYACFFPLSDGLTG
jgi:peptide/nickel transport system ATP-binding protein